MDADEIRFPALQFGRPHGIATFIESATALSRFRYIGIAAANQLAELFLIDSKANKFYLRDARLHQPIGRLHRVWLRLRNPIVEAQFSRIERSTQVTVGELRDRILEDFTENADFWQELADFERLEVDVRQRDTVSSLIELFRHL